MSSQPNGLQTTRYADHLRGCADLAKEIASRLDLRDDSARQACLATIIISADRHNLFLEPVPRDTKVPVKETAPIASGNGARVSDAVIDQGVDQMRDEAAAQRADDQIKTAIRNPTEEQAKAAERTALLDAIDKGRNLLNKEGYTPIMTPKALNEIINDELKFEGNLGTLDIEQLELVAKLLVSRLETFKANRKALDAEAPF